MTIVLSYCLVTLQEYLRTLPRDQRGSYGAVRSAIWEYVMGRVKKAASGAQDASFRSLGGGQGGEDMEVDAIEGASLGDGRRCFKCGRRGHK